MAVLGKRKARSEPSISKEDAAAIFRRHFEAQFAPLPGADVESKSKATKRDDDEDATSVDSDEEDDEEEGSEDGDEWGGLSDDEQSEEEEEEEVPTIEVVDHSGAQPPKPTTMSKRELKAFMSSRPPDQTSRKAEPSTAPAASSSTLPEDAPSLLAQDLELRRLLAESHLLAPAINGAGHAVAAKAFDAGRTRNKATDLRIQALGSKISIHKQEKMPMNMRKGIVAAAGAREAKRRREAKENGVILERETGKKGRRERKRDFGVDRPGVGRLKGAELRLSDRDIRGIEGSRDAFGRRGRR
ncbi:hypothetical protein NCS57_00619300 [Fusarium keratoplasticum]|uniref:Uncharacterized protein n=1 Tax=Fusarium keratoplasticum TaxID=1328300 RepID=A0ACC0R391_9HYPO|nr:hypothetical protein NCS57_00619300 [Fusarium keratoplasticum]KAI8671440.1 hypothetical protein NCS57_00619300 [Fusarium keratoplasticum]KAI8678669.1 hypothetical protein NCS55_00588600 [Fusarium keratoplasticum]